jgi:hypothetical protein
LTLFDWNWAQELDCEIIYLFIYYYFWLDLEPKNGIVEKKHSWTWDQDFWTCNQ